MLTGAYQSHTVQKHASGTTQKSSGFQRNNATSQNKRYMIIEQQKSNMIQKNFNIKVAIIYCDHIGKIPFDQHDNIIQYTAVIEFD